jgi:hypothetical protein
VRQLLTAAIDPTDPTQASPGIVGFLVTFALALATWLLLRSMTKRLRRLRNSPDPAADDSPAEGVRVSAAVQPDPGIPPRAAPTEPDPRR